MPTLNDEVYMSELPKVNVQRSIFNKTFGHKTTFNCGQLIPFDIFECIPGSTHNVTTSVVARLQTLLTPMMDNLFLDISWFFVPFRLIYDKWPQMCGENDAGPWTKDKINYQIPYLTPPEITHEGAASTYEFQPGSLADYFGIPVGVDIKSLVDLGTLSSANYPSALPFRAYAMIVNEFYRDQNLQDPIVIHKDNSNRAAVPVRDYWTDPITGVEVPWYITDLELGGKPFVAARFHDYFSSCLPQPQKGEPVSIFGNLIDPTGTKSWLGSGPLAPVITGERHIGYTEGVVYAQNPKPERFVLLHGDPYGNAAANPYNVLTSDGTVNVAGFNSGTETPSYSFAPGNLWANLNIPEASIPTLRLAFQLQRYYEKQARGGSRYREYLAEFFGVHNGDARMQIPEYLGGCRIPLSIHQVANTGKSEGASLGDLGAMSNTSNTHEDFHMSFSEWGYCIGLACVRYDATYSQGLEKLWSRRDILEFYNPTFCALSDQPVYRREICQMVQPGVETAPDEVFGYQSSWQEYRQQPSRVSGLMRPEVSGTLASWHLADDYSSAPVLSGNWVMCDKSNVDRVLAVTSQISNQVFADFFVKDECVLPMPLHAIPGLADHF